MSLANRVATSLRWTLSARAAAQIATWAVTLFVMRILSPTDYGLNAMAVAWISLLQIIDSLGMGAALIRERSPSEEMMRQVMGAVVVIRVSLFLLLQAFAPLIGQYFGHPDVEPIVRAMALVFIITIFELIPYLRLERAVDYRRISISEFAASIVGAAVVLSLAFAGAGVWALVLGFLINTAVRTAALNYFTPTFTRPWFSVSLLRPHFRFGFAICGDRLLGFLFQESDKFIGGRVLGASSFGLYSVGSHLACLPVNKVMGLINAVTFSAVSSHGRDSKLTSGHVERAARMLSLCAFPVFFGIAAVAPELVPLVIGSQWIPAVPVVQILAPVMPLRMLANLFQPLLWASGAPQASAGNLAVASVAMCIAFLVGVQSGPVGLSLAWLLGYPPVFLWIVWRSSRLLDVAPRRFLAPLAAPLASASLMTGGVWLARTALGDLLGGFWRLSVLILVGAGVFALSMLIVDRRALGELRSFVVRS